MKHLKTRLTILLCVLSIMLLCFGLVACGTKTYKVTLDYNAEQGKVTLSPEAENNEYEEGTELTVTVTPNSDYELDTLTLSTEDRAATPNNEGKFVFKVQEDTTVRVTFKAKTPPPATDKFTLTVPASVANGSIEVSPESADNKYDDGTEITVTLKPAQGYEVDTFTVGGADKKADLQNNVYKFNITADTAINATFKATTPQPAEKFTLTVPASVANGTIEVSPESADGKYEKNAEITVTLKPAQGYEVDTFTVGGADKKADLQNNVYKFNITADTAVNATFKSSEPVVEKFTLTVPASVANGTIEVSPESADGKYEKNAEITVTLKPAQGYEVDTFTVGGADKKADLQNNVYKFNITANTAIAVSFSKIVEKFTLTVPASVDNGSIAVSPESADNKYDEGTEITVTLTPAQGYEVDTFTVGGEDKKADLQNNVYKFNITADTAITVSFSKIVEKFTLTVPASVDNGSIAVSPESADNKYDDGTEITVTLTPAQGYEVDTFTVGSADKKADLQNNVYKFNITADTEISATFKTKVVPVTNITLSEEILALKVGCVTDKTESTHTFTVTFEPENATERELVWESDAQQFVKVEDGKVTAVAAGSANITVKTTDGEHTAMCVVTVENVAHTLTYESRGAEGHVEKCSKCDYVSEEVVGHTMHKVADGDQGHHEECTACTYKASEDITSHSYGEAVLGGPGHINEHKKTCNECGYELYETHVRKYIYECDAQGDESGTGYHCVKCEVCGFFIAHANPHTEGEWKYTDEEHWHQCGGNLIDSQHPCTEVYGKKAPHNMQWTQTPTTHSGTCECGYEIKEEAHDNLGEGGKCSKCGYLAEHTHKDETAKFARDGQDLILAGYKDGLCDECGEPLDNAIWTFDATGKITKFNGDETYTKVVVPVKIGSQTITSLGGTSSSKVFKDNKNITDVIIPAGIDLTSSGGEFSGCTSLQSAMIFGTMSTSSKMSNMFNGCSSLTTLVWGKDIGSLHDRMFGTSPAISKIDVYFVGSSETWDGMVSTLTGAAKTVLEADNSNVRFYKAEGGSASAKEWYWDVDGVTPKAW